MTRFVLSFRYVVEDKGLVLEKLPRPGTYAPLHLQGQGDSVAIW